MNAESGITVLLDRECHAFKHGRSVVAEHLEKIFI
jgi:hypothetical protein